jgi:hypothetical protein
MMKRIMIAGAATLAACGGLGLAPAAAQASSASAPTWTKQHPAVHPYLRWGASMAYDAATGTAVLFGGYTRHRNEYSADTWVWNGTTWTQQDPAVHPSARFGASMAYDAANGTVVLFGGVRASSDGARDDTWTWNGTTWTHQHPAVHPTARYAAAMSYDAATSSVVMFGGRPRSNGELSDTWTWNGTTWTHQHPAVHPSVRSWAAMSYDAATSGVVMFGGFGFDGTLLADTWTWNGTTWTQQHPAVHPHARDLASMSYDAATSTAVMFGGTGGSTEQTLGGTWTWDGTTWTKQTPATSPSARYGASMAYDAATGTIVLFGGETGYRKDFGNTWTWG